VAAPAGTPTRIVGPSTVIGAGWPVSVTADQPGSYASVTWISEATGCTCTRIVVSETRSTNDSRSNIRIPSYVIRIRSYPSAVAITSPGTVGVTPSGTTRSRTPSAITSSIVGLARTAAL
jgi:hypothetical protein